MAVGTFLDTLIKIVDLDSAKCTNLVIELMYCPNGTVSFHGGKWKGSRNRMNWRQVRVFVGPQRAPRCIRAAVWWWWPCETIRANRSFVLVHSVSCEIVNCKIQWTKWSKFIATQRQACVCRARRLPSTSGHWQIDATRGWYSLTLIQFVSVPFCRGWHQ